MKVLIAVPTYENIYPDTFKAIYQLDKGGHDVDFDFFRGYDVAKARNTIAEATIEGGYDYVLMIDNDEVPPKDAMINLLDTERSYPLERCMAVGYCLSRPSNQANTNGRTTAFKYGGQNYTVEDAYKAEELKALCAEGITKIQIRGSGLGCALIHRDVFEALQYPYFRWVEYENKTKLSEDLYFCEMMTGIARPVFVDTRVACGHMMRHIDFIK